MHHKRKRPRNRRAGCKLCKPWKINGLPKSRPDGERFTDHRRRFAVNLNDPDTVQNWRCKPPSIP